MLTLIIAAIVAMAVYFLSLFFDSTFLKTLSICILILGIIIPFTVPNQYKDPVLVKEIELVSLSNSVSSEGSGNLFYVSVSSSNVYSYRYKVDKKFGMDGEAYKLGVVSNNVTEVESKECIKPVLKVYKHESKTNWFLYKGHDKMSYVFYVPEGSITKEISLK